MEIIDPQAPIPTQPNVRRPRRDPGPVTTEDFVNEIKATADKLLGDGAARGDVKLLSSAIKELRYCFKIFNMFRGRPKVTIFGSARTKPDNAGYQQAVKFGKLISEAGYMVITGAASGIMEAGHVGAEKDMSLGVNIMLPFEQSANPIILGDMKLMTMRYFFTRKLMFVKESDAIVLFPGGFGTHDEGFETLTLIQTGKSHMFPIVCVDEPGGTYWKTWDAFIRTELLGKGMISPADLALYKVTDDVEEAVREIVRFHRVYHSMRYVRNVLYMRLRRKVSDATLEKIRGEFKDICKEGTFDLVPAHDAEGNEKDIFDLPRLRFAFDRHGHGRLRLLIDTLNEDGL